MGNFNAYGTLFGASQLGSTKIASSCVKLPSRAKNFVKSFGKTVSEVNRQCR